jgi:chromosome partitioning protein
MRAQENIKDVVDELEMLIRSNWQSTQSTLNTPK